MTAQEILGMLDSTLLAATATEADVRALCADAVRCGFGLVMINPRFVPLAVAETARTRVKVGTVIDFPLGAGSDRDKCAQIVSSIEAGADEVDLVAGVGALLAGDRQSYAATLAAARKAAGDRVLKVILETCWLDGDRIDAACALCARAGADFVKTSTGFGSGGATVEDVARMKRATSAAAAELGARPLGVKASGGIRTLEQVLEFLRAGANRIGTSNAVSIARELAEGTL